MSNFKVGEVAIYVCDVANTPEMEVRAYDGTDALIVKGFGQYPTWDADGAESFTFGYLVRFPDGFKAVAEPHELRKKHPPKSDDVEARQAMLDCIERARMGQGVTV